MQPILAANAVVDIATIIAPIATFVAGYWLSSRDRIRDARQRLANMRSILIKELDENAQPLNELWPVSDNLAEAVPFGDIIGDRCAMLSTAVYDRYLDRLDALSPTELDKIYDAYKSVAHAIEAGRAYRLGRADDLSHESMVQLVSAALFTADTALRDMLNAVKAIQGGSAVHDRLLAERGSAMKRATEMKVTIEGAFAREPSAIQEPRGSNEH